MWRALALAVCIALAVVGVAAFPATPASATVGDNYPEPWRSQPLGHSYDTWLHATRYCTSWVGWALHDRNGFELPFNDHAKGWAGKAEALGYTVDTTPAIGAVAWWDGNHGGGYGHVAYVERINQDGSKALISEYNFDLMGNYHERWIVVGNPTGYIHFQDLSTTTSAQTHPDFSNDQRADLAWHQGTTLFHLTGSPNGTFTYLGQNTNGPIGTPQWSGSGQTDNAPDTQEDVLWYAGGVLSVLKWHSGTWALAGNTHGLGPPDYAVAGNFTAGDNRVDIAWHQGNDLFLLVGQANGTFTLGGAQNSGPIATPAWAGSGDVDADGKDEVYWYAGGVLSVFKWTTTWALAGQTFGLGAPDYAVTGKFTNDNKTDIAWHQGSDLFLLAGQANGTFPPSGYNDQGPIGTPVWGGSGDFDNDGNDELYWYQGGALAAFKWTTTWVVAGVTYGLGQPGAVVVGG